MMLQTGTAPDLALANIAILSDASSTCHVGIIAVPANRGLSLFVFPQNKQLPHRSRKACVKSMGGRADRVAGEAMALSFAAS
jgi:hypothetical protein